MLDRRVRPDRVGDRLGGDERQLGPARDRRRRQEHDREQRARPGSSTQVRPSRPRPSVWCSASATAPCAAPRREHPLRRRRLGRVVVLAAVGAPQGRQDDVGASAARRTRVGRPCNLRLAATVRSSETCARTGRSSTNGSRTRFSCDVPKTETNSPSRRSARAMPRASSGSRCTSCATPRTRATPPRSRWSSSCGGSEQFRGRVAVLDLAAPARRQHVQGRRPGALGGRAPHRAAARGHARRARRRPGARARARETRRELGALPRRAAAAQASVVALKDAFDSSFDEISAATGLPVGTAKCYAHRGRTACGTKLSA